MKKVIVVTGTPGTGKTTVAMRLAKKVKWTYVDVNSVIAHNKLSEGYDRKKKCKIIDVKKLNKILLKTIKESEENLIIDSHMAHYLPASSVDACVVTKCNLKLLNRRLKRRNYPDAKIKENLECEIFDVCRIEASEAGHNVIILETDSKVDYEKLIRKINRTKKEKNKK